MAVGSPVVVKAVRTVGAWRRSGAQLSSPLHQVFVEDMRDRSRPTVVGGDPTRPPHQFRIELRPDRDRVVVAPSGELDLGTVPALAGAVDGLVECGFDAP